MTELDLALRALLVGLAGWRTASLLVNEEGPFEIFQRVRAAVGLEGTDAPVTGLRAVLFGVLVCVWCASVWTAAGFWFLWELEPAVVALMAAMAVAAMAERWARG